MVTADGCWNRGDGWYRPAGRGGCSRCQILDRNRVGLRRLAGHADWNHRQTWDQNRDGCHRLSDHADWNRRQTSGQNLDGHHRLSGRADWNHRRIAGRNRAGLRQLSDRNRDGCHPLAGRVDWNRRQTGDRRQAGHRLTAVRAYHFRWLASAGNLGGQVPSVGSGCLARRPARADSPLGWSRGDRCPVRHGRRLTLRGPARYRGWLHHGGNGRMAGRHHDYSAGKVVRRSAGRANCWAGVRWPVARLGDGRIGYCRGRDHRCCASARDPDRPMRLIALIRCPRGGAVPPPLP